MAGCSTATGTCVGVVPSVISVIRGTAFRWTTPESPGVGLTGVFVIVVSTVGTAVCGTATGAAIGVVSTGTG